ncbi:MAG: PorP/SprF family type IX secretion system membrane protein [Paludibacteraceae bacterium]|nr:PorP/SprF family type IX secretion system membrane protein [Paludibacteraceae bacterium]
MKRLFQVIVGLFMAITASAQQDLLMTQQFFSRINKNPAGVGNFEQIDFFLLGRFQWVDIKDSPKTGVFNVQKFVDKYNSGFGFTMSYDDLGASKGAYNPKLCYAYVLRLREDMVMSLGLGAGVQYHYIDFNKYSLVDETERADDHDFGYDDDSKVSPDVDFGVEFSMPKLLLGVSGNHLTTPKSTTMSSGIHINAYGRYFADLNPKWVLAPAAAFMYHEKVAVLEVNAMAFYKNFLWFGMTYHPDMFDKFGTNPVAFQVGTEYKNLRFGYTFDYNFGSVANLSGSAHEIMLSYSLQTKKTKEPYERFE